MSAPDNVRDIDSARPYVTTARAYYRRGWHGALPIKAGEKAGGMPSGVTGDNPYPTFPQVKSWVESPKYRTANIALRMPSDIDDKYDVLGIDVDHYDDKNGGDELEALEAQYGDLPATWRSTSRGHDNPSGIRFFLVPKGLHWPDKIKTYIDTIQTTHRYAVVAPSWHPKTKKQYVWFNPDGKQVAGISNIPQPKTFPLLPQPWIDFITEGKIREQIPMDRESKVSDVEQWALTNFVDGEKFCDFMQKRFDIWKETIDSDFAKHDKIKHLHWEILNLGPEGHTGWSTAVVELENYWIDSIKRDRPDRDDLRTIADEMFRSRIGALRKIKGAVESEAKNGLHGIVSQCGCSMPQGWGKPEFRSNDGRLTLKKTVVDSVATKPAGSPEDPEGSQLYSSVKAVSEYDTTDDGNGEHLRDLSLTPEGASVRFVHDQTRYGTWITWADSSATWKPDKDGGNIRASWRKVKERQRKYVLKLEEDYDDAVFTAKMSEQPISGMNAPIELIRAKAKFAKWSAHLEKSGNNRHAEEAIKNAGKLPEISCSRSQLDANKNLLAVANGVLELGDGRSAEGDFVRLRPGRMADLITMNTGVPWLAEAADRDPVGVKLWDEFLDKFLPDPDVRRIAQIAMGSTLVGGNQERVMLIFIGESSTGKSTFSRVCASAYGDYGAPIGKEAFQGYKFKPALTLNASRRFVTNSEFDSRTQMSTAVIKEMTGGGDLIPTESKGVDEVVVSDLHFTPGIATNKMPGLIDPDTAVERRLYPIHFDHVMPEGKAKGDFVDLMERHALDSVLAWMVEGYRMYRALGGLVRNETTEAWRKEVMAEVDDISLFIGECLIVADNHRDGRIRWQDTPDRCTLVADLYSRYQLWYSLNNYPAYQILSSHKFSSRMKDLGYLQDYRKFDGSGERRWLGVKIKGTAGPARPARLKLRKRSSKVDRSVGLKSVE